MENQEDNHKWMRKAMEMAEEALSAGEVPVGCVFVRDEKIIAKARNRTNELRNATRHAELEAIDEMLAKNLLTSDSSNSLLHDVVLYVTVEPCIMCSSALRQLGIKRCFRRKQPSSASNRSTIHSNRWSLQRRCYHDSSKILYHRKHKRPETEAESQQSAEDRHTVTNIHAYIMISII
ncbi:tRNA-specific adenosine deaminase [Abortiporus biennis]